MLITDEYKTIADNSFGEFKDRGSKFFGYAYPTTSEEEVKEWLEVLKKEHPKARHFCYAYRLDLAGNQFRANDDGEPSGTAGKPILGQIDSFELTKVLVVIVRYFGGTKLGASGLINAYKTTAQLTLAQATIINKTVNDIYSLTFDYAIMSDIMGFLKKRNIEITKEVYIAKPTLEISMPKNSALGILDQLNELINPYGQENYEILVKHIDTV